MLDLNPPFPRGPAPPLQLSRSSGLSKRAPARLIEPHLSPHLYPILQVECGYQFTSKLEGMFTDMRVSADMQENFRAARGGSSKVMRCAAILFP